jgi:hypothetical protein
MMEFLGVIGIGIYNGNDVLVIAGIGGAWRQLKPGNRD